MAEKVTNSPGQIVKVPEPVRVPLVAVPLMPAIGAEVTSTRTDPLTRSHTTPLSVLIVCRR